jgi:protoporphyrinogen oxidase
MKIFIIGGGIAGILAAILLKKKNKESEVYLIESAPECGGLLRSVNYSDEYYFDLGSHVIAGTGIKELDEILFKNVDEKYWNSFDVLKSANFFNGALYRDSNLLPLHLLPKDTYESIVIEILSNLAEDEQQGNLAEYSESVYGKVVTNNIFMPLLKKLQGTTDELHQNALTIFGLTRVIIGGSKMMNVLKESSYLDGILGYSSNADKEAGETIYYPKNGGIGVWVDQLVKQALEVGVEIKTDTSIQSIVIGDAAISSLVLTDGSKSTVDKLYWTAPVSQFAKLVNPEYKFNYRPDFVDMVLYHFVFEEKFLIDNHYVYCNDPDMSSFRVTLYSNLDDSTNGYRCTVEVMESIGESNAQVVQSELVRMGVVAESNSILFKVSQNLKNGFPVFTEGFVNENNRVLEDFSGRYSNCIFMGKAASDKFFMNDILIDAFKKISMND